MSVFLVSPEESNERLDVFLASKTGKSRSVIQEQVKAGAVRINEKPTTKAATRLNSGDSVAFELMEPPAPSLAPVEGTLDIIFEDEYLLVLNKAQGIVIHPAPGNTSHTLVHHLLHHLHQESLFQTNLDLRPGIVHRLDKGTSGVLLVAKTREVQDALSLQFKNRSVKKTYECVVWGQLIRKGALKSSIGRDRIHRKKMSSKTQKARMAETHFAPLKTYRHATHLEVTPLTGRTHQIRVHLSEFGYSIIGDPLYGKGPTPKRLESLDSELAAFIKKAPHTFLHARSLSFLHPVSQEQKFFEAPRPLIFNHFLELLNGKDAI